MAWIPTFGLATSLAQVLMASASVKKNAKEVRKNTSLKKKISAIRQPSGASSISAMLAERKALTGARASPCRNLWSGSRFVSMKVSNKPSSFMPVAKPVFNGQSSW